MCRHYTVSMGAFSNSEVHARYMKKPAVCIWRVVLNLPIMEAAGIEPASENVP